MATEAWGRAPEAESKCLECGLSSYVQAKQVTVQHRNDCSKARAIERDIKRDALQAKIAEQERAMGRAEDMKITYQRELDKLDACP